MTSFYPPHYSPFGSSLPNRTWSDGNRGYRFGFNGKEKDSETASDNYDFGARIYDARLGRWLSLDPLKEKYSSLSPFIYVLNNPTSFYDPDGKDVVIGFISSFNQQGMNAIQNSVTISNYINQFASKISGNQFFYSNLSANQTTGPLAGKINLNFNSIIRTTPQGLTMIAAGQDAQTTFTYNLSDGTTIAAAAYVPVVGVTVISANINLDVLSDNILPANNINGSAGNQNCLAAAYTSIAITNELYSSVDNFVSILNANTVDGITNYADVTAALSASGPPPVSPNLINAQNDLINKNSDTRTDGFIQMDNYTGTTFLCKSTYSTGFVIQNNAIPAARGSIANSAYPQPTGICPPQGIGVVAPGCYSVPTPENLREGNLNKSVKCNK